MENAISQIPVSKGLIHPELLTFYSQLEEGVVNIETYQRLLSSYTNSIVSQPPVQSNNRPITSLGYDRLAPYRFSDTPELLRSKEDAAPNYLFNIY